MTDIKPDLRQLGPTGEIGPRTGEKRLVKDRSGNSSGLRKRKNEGPRVYFSEILRSELCRVVNVRQGNNTEKMTTIRAIIRQLTEAALNGDQRAQYALLAQYSIVKDEKQEQDLTLLSDEELQTMIKIMAKSSIKKDPN